MHIGFQLRNFPHYKSSCDCSLQLPSEGGQGPVQLHHLPRLHLHRPGPHVQERVHRVPAIPGLSAAAREAGGQVWFGLGAPPRGCCCSLCLLCRYADSCIILPPPPTKNRVKSVSVKMKGDEETDNLGKSVGKCLHSLFPQSICTFQLTLQRFYLFLLEIEALFISISGWSGWEASSG